MCAKLFVYTAVLERSKVNHRLAWSDRQTASPEGEFLHSLLMLQPKVINRKGIQLAEDRVKQYSRFPNFMPMK